MSFKVWVAADIGCKDAEVGGMSVLMSNFGVCLDLGVHFVPLIHEMWLTFRLAVQIQ